MHPLINAIESYEPIKGSKSRWLFTRKKALPSEMGSYPGLYQTHNYNVDFFMFILVIGLELYGLYILRNVIPPGYKNVPIYAFIADVVFAILAHLGNGWLCIAKNKKRLAENGNIRFTKNPDDTNADTEIEKYKWKIVAIMCWLVFFDFIIVGLAVLKFVSILTYSTFVGGFVIFLFVIYIICIPTIHIFFTGYFLSELWFRFFIKMEKRKLKFTLKSKLDTHPTAVKELRRETLANIYGESAANKHFIKTENEKSVLYTWGILQDDALITLVNKQDDSNRKKLATELVAFQLFILKQNAQTPSESTTDNNVIMPATKTQS